MTTGDGSGVPGEHEWRRLQYDAPRALIDCQRASVDLHRQAITTLRADAGVHRRARFELLDLASVLDALHIFVGEIERTLAELPSRAD